MPQRPTEKAWPGFMDIEPTRLGWLVERFLRKGCSASSHDCLARVFCRVKDHQWTSSLLGHPQERHDYP